MKDFRPLPRPVDVALPPSATVMAERTALLPPVVVYGFQLVPSDDDIRTSVMTYKVHETMHNAEGNRIYTPMIKLICGPNVNVRNL